MTSQCCPSIFDKYTETAFTIPTITEECQVKVSSFDPLSLEVRTLPLLDVSHTALSTADRSRPGGRRLSGGSGGGQQVRRGPRGRGVVHQLLSQQPGLFTVSGTDAGMGSSQ